MLKIINTRVLLSFITIVAAATLIIGATSAFFSDTEISTDNTLTAGAIDLKIDNTSYLNGVLSPGTTWTLNDLTNQLFFNFTDVKPGDLGEDTISLNAENDYWLCANLTLTANDDNTCTEPEKLDDSTCSETNTDLFDGELADNINFIFWADDGDNVLETGEEIIKEGTALDVLNSSIVLADSETNNLGDPNGIPAEGGVNSYIGKAWCFGTLTKVPVQAGGGVNPTVNGGVECDGFSLNNATQTDKILADIKFDAVQARNNRDFVCSSLSPTPTPTPTPIISCTSDTIQFVSSVYGNDQGRRKDGTAVLADRSNPSLAFGLPQTTGAPFDTVTPNSFFSLGFPNVRPSTASASIVFGFAQSFFNGPGDDLQIFEVTGGPTYPEEKVKVEISMNPGGPWTVLSAGSVRDASLDLGSVVSAQYVRLTDVSDIGLFEATADGYDVDAVKSLCKEI
jgi:predicted ribosomally synthesized peptide with SipW-like signal peptide